MDPLKAPFIWFGGKRRVAAEVWDAIGDVDNYVEPFAGSLAVLLGRPLSVERRRAETVNDADMFLANFWRALASNQEAVAFHADWPVNECDLFARHLWLVNEGRSAMQAGLESDPDWFDARIAGWWCWGLNAWIGSGWCAGTGPWTYDSCKRPHLGNAGRGVRLLPYFSALGERLRDVRVCCGDWSRVVTDGALNYGSIVGVFLDPPYLGNVRTKDLYATDDHNIAADVRTWALAHGDDPRLRIVLAGYHDEHAAFMPPSWRVLEYSANKSYGSAAGGGVNEANRHKERLWFSPHCLQSQPDLFSLLGAGQ